MLVGRFTGRPAASPASASDGALAFMDWMHFTQRAQYPLIKKYTLNNKGIHVMI